MLEQQQLRLRERQLSLRLRSAELRGELSADLARAAPWLDAAEEGVGLLRHWRRWRALPKARSPIWPWLSFGMAALVAWRTRRWPQQAWPALRLALRLWKLWQQLRPATAAKAPSPQPQPPTAP